MSDTATAAASVTPTRTPDHLWLSQRITEIAEDLGRLYRHALGTDLEWRANRLCDNTWNILATFSPTAADLHRAGHSIEAALLMADVETRRLNRLLAR